MYIKHALNYFNIYAYTVSSIHDIGIMYTVYMYLFLILFFPLTFPYRPFQGRVEVP